MSSAVQKLAGAVPKAIQVGRATLTPKLNTFWKYAKVELKPPTPAEWPQVAQGFQNLAKAVRTQKWKQLTVKEAFINAVVATEVICWFFVGECIGKGTLIGYQIKGAVDFDLHL
ncbi:hypothetical protein HELRODRAFT_189182, partial [Helobdella robusta]|uniref:ATP synthase subunit g n=1 Tax=Helobdella robusta TaxID=6412 RepID=T1FQR4_HELRO